MCHCHQKKIVQRYITIRAKLEASQKLKKIVFRLTFTTEKNLTNLHCGISNYLVYSGILVFQLNKAKIYIS